MSDIQRRYFPGTYKGFDYLVVNYYENEEIVRKLKSIAGHLVTSWWCGYVVLKSNSPWYKKDYDSVPVSVHGDLTFRGPLPKDSPLQGYAIGFDMNHAGDEGGNRSLAEKECKHMIDQL